MVEPTNQDDSWANRIWSALLMSLVVSGIGGFILVLYLGSQNGSVPSFLVESGPFLLVLVTLINIGLSGLAFLESRKERELTRATLDESRKAGVIETIARTIEPIDSELEVEESLLNSPQDQLVSYTDIYPNQPDEDLMADISYYYPGLIEDMTDYLSQCDDYNQKRTELSDWVGEHVESEGIPDEILQQLSDHITNEDMKDSSLQIKQAVMKEEIDVYSNNWVVDNNEEDMEAIISLRETHVFREEFEALEEIRQDTLEKNRDIRDNLHRAKEDMMERYRITESEIRRRVDEP